mmetsp:Transcript_19304/g.35552  ORF Transcript_19304/g.35552 Transcript_19304/m.35552 type:complete len:154 (-) Transcript_19304:1897-2358(-)
MLIIDRKQLETTMVTLQAYYNRHLLNHLKFHRWDEFFYTYKLAGEFGHGVDQDSHLLASFGYVLGYQNLPKAEATLELVQNERVRDLARRMFRLYLDLLSEGTAPKPTDYMMYAEVLLHMQNPMWESLLRPWNLRTNRAELLDYTKFRLRMPK